MKKYNLYGMIIIILLLLSGCDFNKNKSKEIESKDLPEMISNDFSGDYVLEEIPSSPLQIGEPSGLCIYNDNLVVCDRKNGNLVILDKECNFIKKIGILGMGPLEFTKPTGITVYDGKLYILDSGNNRIQVLDSNYLFKEGIQLDKLAHEQGGSEYRDIAVDKSGIIYVSTNSAALVDGHIFRVNEGKIDKLEQQFIGHLYSYNGTVYATDIQVLNQEGTIQKASNGKNSLYRIENDELIKINDLPYKYTPAGICIYDEMLYTVSGLWSRVDIFSLEGELVEPVIKVPNHTLDRYLTVYDNNLIYCTDMDGASLFKISKTDK